MPKIYSHTLKNNLQVLVYPDIHARTVSSQMWYGVGSKDERSGERGLAHLLEHMIFKGTRRLSESDINLITHKLSGYTNAFTSHDFTGYMFDFPQQYWHIALDLFADCMVNCTFKTDFLNSELKAVVQELKMYKDDYVTSLMEEMTSLIFDNHPYHYPIIGYKQDLCAITQEGLLAFYKKHYVPNNAALIMVGNVDPDKIFAVTEDYFGNIPADNTYKKTSFPISYDIKRTRIQLKRDVEQPIVLFAWQIPGAREGLYFYFDILKWLVVQGNGSRLYKKLVQELQLASHVDGFIENMSDQALFFVRIYPKDEESIFAIIQAVADEIDCIQNKKYEESEIQRAMRQVKMHYISLFENPSELAYAIGQSWFSLHNESYILDYLNHDIKEIIATIDQLIPLLSISRMHEGSVVSMDAEDREQWVAIQRDADTWDEKILSQKERNTAVEPGLYVDAIQTKDVGVPKVPAYSSMVTNQGLTLIAAYNDRVDKVDIILDMRAKSFYDPAHLPGLAHFTYSMLEEGCKQFPGLQYMQELESYGMTLDISAGIISLTVLKDDIEKGFQLLTVLLQDPLFDTQSVEKVRMQIMSELNEFWDTPSDFVSHLAEEKIYAGHPFGHYYLGTRDAVMRITQDDIALFWQRYGSPNGAYLAVVGAVTQDTVVTLFNKTLAYWRGLLVQELIYPVLKPIKKEVIYYPINRDQIVLCFAGLSVDRMHPLYDALLIFDQILTGGLLGSMSSRLFQLREQTGLFYTIGGSVVLDACHEPGMVMIKTIVSLDRLKEATDMIKHTLSVVPETLDDQEIESAKNAIINSLNDAFSTNNKIAQTYIFLARYGLDASYIEQRAHVINAISKQQIQDAAQQVLNDDVLITVLAGRNI